MLLNTSHSLYEFLYINCGARRMKDACTKLKVRGGKHTLQAAGILENIMIL
jgi:hypothetical protein